MTETLTDTVTPTAADEVRGLTDRERAQLDKLMAKANAAIGVHAPAVRIGKPYVALVNLAVPRRQLANGERDLQTDLVMRGETVYLTDEEAAKFLRNGPRDGRRIAVIRPAGEVDSNHLPNAVPQLLTGPIFRPVTPAPGTDGPRPDPEGSTRVIEQTVVPESQVMTPQPGGAPSIQDALDLPPGTVIGGAGDSRAEAIAGADQDLMAAVKNQAGMGPGGSARRR
jgi:hypothetical protein